MFKVGQRFGRLVLRQKVRDNPRACQNLKKRWVCDCDCGQRITIPQYYLIRIPNPKQNCGSCSDLKGPKVKFNSEYRIWLMMQMRCNDPHHISYKYYGGRGIKVCEEWSSPTDGFESFLKHIGPRPSMEFSVDRIDVDKDYQPGNVRWATAEQQAQNKRNKPNS
jgi:hypothetical protein